MSSILSVDSLDAVAHKRRNYLAPKSALTIRSRDPQAGNTTLDIRAALVRVGQSVARKRADRDSRALGRETELASEATSAAGLALGKFIARADRLGIATARATFGFLPGRGRFPRSVYVAAHRAADAALRKMGRSESVATSFFDVFAVETPERLQRNAWAAPEHLSAADAMPWADARPAELPMDLQARLVLSRCESVRERIRNAVAGTSSNRRIGAAKRHLATVERCQAAALAALAGETFGLESAHRFTAEIVGHETERLTVRASSGRIVSHDGKGTTTGARKVAARGGIAEANSLAWQRVKALADFIGVEFSAKRNGFAFLF